MKRKLMIILAVTLFCPKTFSQDVKSALVLDRRDLSLRVKMLNPQIFFGDTIPLTVTLESKDSVGLFDLETAWLHFQLRKYEDGKYVEVNEQGWNRTTGGTYQYHITKSGMHQLRRLKQKKIQLKQGDVLTRRFELNGLMGEFTYPGRYMLRTTYEWQVKDSTQFTVRLAYRDAIPRLLEHIRNNNNHGRISPYKVFVYLTGYVPGDKVIQPDEEHLLVPQLSNWWNANKDLVLKVEATLDRKEYKDLDYSKRVTAIIKAMGSDDYRKRLVAFTELENITNIMLLPPSEQDSAGLISRNAQMVMQWWNRNKTLIEWINRVIIENRVSP